MMSLPHNLIGRTIDGYCIERQIGKGGAGAVYVGTNEKGEQRAIKVVIPPLFVDNDALMRIQRRFVRETTILSSLNHPHILPVISFGEDPDTGFLYIVMPYMNGGTLAKRIASHSLSFVQILSYIQSLAEALDYAHARKVIHRDIKPANVLLDEHNRVYLADFGIAKLYDSDSMLSAVTETQQIMGTPLYMAPEQILEKDKLTPATDVYGLGVLTYQMITGRLPFASSPEVLLVLKRIAYEDPPSPRLYCQRLPAATAAVMLRALAKEPERRFTSACAFVDALRQSLRVLPASLLHDVPGCLSTDWDEVDDVDCVTSQGRYIDVHEHIADVMQDAIPVMSMQRANARQQVSQVQHPVVVQPKQEKNGQLAGWHRTLLGVAIILLCSVSAFAYFYHDAPSVAALNGHTTSEIMPTISPSSEKEHGISSTPVPIPTPSMSSRSNRVPESVPMDTGKAIVTVQPNSQTLQDTEIISATTGQPDANQYQIQARMISVQTPAQSSTVSATGQTSLPATASSGMLLVTQKSFLRAINWPAGYTISGVNSSGSPMTMVLDQPFSLGVAQLNSAPLQGYVHAHTLQVGIQTNITGVNGFSAQSSSNSSMENWSVSNDGDFMGGADAENITYVQQSDLDRASNALNVQPPDPQSLLESQLKVGETLANVFSCKPTTTFDHAVNDHASSVTATRWFNCSGEAYNQTLAAKQAQLMFQNNVSTQLGNNYVLSSNLSAIFKGATVSNSNGDGVVELSFVMSGTWTYQFSDAEEQAMKQAIAGKSLSAAESILRKWVGVQQVLVSSSNGDTLPEEINQIQLTVNES
jgi:serine/threonine protein kinase